MKTAVMFGLLLVAVLIAPTASFAVEALGIKHAIPCFQCAPDAPDSVHVARNTAPVSLIINVDIYDANGIKLGQFIIPDPAGTFFGRQVVFTTAQALAAASPSALPNGLYAAVIFDSAVVANILYEGIGLGPGGITGVLTGRGNLYGYAGVTRALTLFPESVGGTPTGLTNFFVCNNPANNMATFLGVAGPAPGAQGVAQLFTVAGDIVLNNYATQNLFARPLSALSPGASGGTLFLVSPGATVMSCVKFVRVNVPGLVSTVGGYTY